MGMFDYIRYEGEVYQTKDTPHQFMGEYEIRGKELWFNNVEHAWVDDEDSFLGGYLVSKRNEWYRLQDFEGAVRFYDDDTEYFALFWEGEMIRIRKYEGDSHKQLRLL